MAISAKGKRRISVDGRVYLWRVFNEYDQSWFDCVQVTVAAMDQELFLHYGMEQPEERRTAMVTRGRPERSARIPCPRFEGEDGLLTPRGVRQLIEWGLAVAL